ncbi:hypothetical protein HDV00_006142 [Rhizophlyctis rosea]|nr:hypothetical protein HDV00_006142 [Rhizophlyctis rosea]
MNGSTAPGEYYIAIWLGNLADYIPPPKPPPYIEPPFVGPRGETTFSDIDISKYSFLSANQTGNNDRMGDRGIFPEWDCSGAIYRGWPLPMNISASAYYDYSQALVYLRDMYSANWVARDAWSVPNPVLGCVDYDNSPDLKANCTNGAPAWQCPDHWWFNNMQLGVLKSERNILRPLTNLTLNYFKTTGFDPAVDMMGQTLTLVTSDGVQYAMPVYVNGRPWWVRQRLFSDYLVITDIVKAIPFPAPPPLADWGAAWWIDWNITTFLNMLDYMYDERNMTGIFFLPADISGTAFYTYLGIPFGSLIFDAAGRCGMDAKSEVALNNTLMHWLSKPGLLSDPYIPDPAAFQAWLAKPINFEKPWNDYGPSLWHPSWAPSNTWTAQGFDTSACYNADCAWIYPPTGMSMITAGFVGIPTNSRNPDIAYEALMYAIVRNEGVQANVPQSTLNTGGISAWLSAQNLPEWSTAQRWKWQGLVTHGVFAGYPSPQTYGYYETNSYDPLHLVTAEIQYKNLSVRDAVTRACKLINYATRPPCTSKEWQVNIITDPKTNKDTISYSWPADVDERCRTDFAVTEQLPPNVVNYLSSTTISHKSTAGKGIMAMITIGIIIEVLLIIAFCWYRHTPVIRAASFVPSLMIMFGAILGLISVPFRISQSANPNWLQCFGTYWSFSLGFSSLLGSLAMKTFRVDRIFRSGSKGISLVISNFQLICYIMLLNLGNVILMLVFQFWIVDDSCVKATPMPNSKIVLYQPDCPVVHSAASAMLYAYNALIVLLAGVYAYRTRNIISSFNENSFTVAAISLISVISIIIVPVLQIINSAEATFILVSLGTFLASVLSTLVFAIPKLLISTGMMRGEDVSSALQKNVKNVTSMGGQQGGLMSIVRTGESGLKFDGLGYISYIITHRGRVMSAMLWRRAAADEGSWYSS